MNEVLETLEKPPTADLEQQAFEEVAAEFQEDLNPVHEKMWKKMQGIILKPSNYNNYPLEAEQRIKLFLDFIESYPTPLQKIKWAWQCLGFGRGMLLSDAVFSAMEVAQQYKLQAIYAVAQGLDLEDVAEEDEFDKI